MYFTTENLESLERQLILLGFLDYKRIISTSVETALMNQLDRIATMKFIDNGKLVIEHDFMLKMSGDTWTLFSINAEAKCQLPFVQNNYCIVNGMYHLQDGLSCDRRNIKSDLDKKLAKLILSHSPALKEELVKLGFEDEIGAMQFKLNIGNYVEFELKIKLPGTKDQTPGQMHFVILTNLDQAKGKACIEQLEVTRYSYWNIEDGATFYCQQRLPCKNEIMQSASLYLLELSIREPGMRTKDPRLFNQQEILKNTASTVKRKF